MLRKYVFFLIAMMMFGVACRSIQNEKEDLSIFLQATQYINSDHPDIVAKAAELTQECKTQEDEARVLYEFVRDFHNMVDSVYTPASETLKIGGRSCFDRAVLLCALCRSVGIPARMHIQKVTLKNRRKVKGEWVNSIFLHGIMGMYLNGHWRLYDTEGYEWKWVFWTRDESRASEMPLPFSPDHDCTLPSNDKAIFETLPVYSVDSWFTTMNYSELGEIFAGMLSDDKSVFIESGTCIDSDHPRIIQKAKELTRNIKTETEMVKALYEYVRDSYNDNPSDSYKASDVLEYGGNNCIRRSTLLAALCRAAGIPARLHMQEFTMIDYKLPNGEVKDLRSPHVITGVFFDGNWRLYDATGNEKKWVGFNRDEKVASEMPLSFYPDRDCIFPSNDRIKFTPSMLYFSDWSETHEEFKNRVIMGEIGIYYAE
jgi:transglutaminase-like putative cysteine protease